MRPSAARYVRIFIFVISKFRKHGGSLLGCDCRCGLGANSKIGLNRPDKFGIPTPENLIQKLVKVTPQIFIG